MLDNRATKKTAENSMTILFFGSAFKTHAIIACMHGCAKLPDNYACKCVTGVLNIDPYIVYGMNSNAVAIMTTDTHALLFLAGRADNFFFFKGPRQKELELELTH